MTTEQPSGTGTTAGAVILVVLLLPSVIDVDVDPPQPSIEYIVYIDRSGQGPGARIDGGVVAAVVEAMAVVVIIVIVICLYSGRGRINIWDFLRSRQRVFRGG